MKDKDLSPAEETYIWGFPLVSVHRTRLLHGVESAPGRLNHVKHLATPRDRRIVAPNNDTLYSSGWYDLSHGDLLLHVPPMDKDDRYWNVMVVDAYTHVSYITRRQYGVNGAEVRVTFDPTSANGEGESHTVRLGTPTAWVIIRVLVESEDDLAIARALQESFEVSTYRPHPRAQTKPAGRAPDIGKAGPAFFSELKRYLALDPPAPWHPKLSADALVLLEDPSAYPQEALAAAVSRADSYIRSGAFQSTVIRNGWSTGRAAGGPGDDIARRARGAMFGLGGHYAIENRSYIAVHDADGQDLDGDRPLKLCFPAEDLPPCEAFWSLTAYGPDLYLVENELDRWSIGDRTEDLRYEEDGSLTVVLSSARPEASVNWLPVPSGAYKLGLRVYEGTREVVDCQWFPPTLIPLKR